MNQPRHSSWKSERLSDIYQEICQIPLSSVSLSQSASNEYAVLFSQLVELSRQVQTATYCQYMLTVSEYFNNWPLKVDICFIVYSSRDFDCLGREFIETCDNIFNQALLRLCLSGLPERSLAKSKRRIQYMAYRYRKLPRSPRSVRILHDLYQSQTRIDRIEVHIKKLYDYSHIECPGFDRLYSSYSGQFEGESISNSLTWKMTLPIRMIIDRASSVPLLSKGLLYVKLLLKTSLKAQ